MSQQDRQTADSERYRVISRGTAAVLVAAIAVVAGLLLWYALGWIELTSERITVLSASAPRRAAEELSFQLKVIGAVNAGVLTALSLYLAWFAWRGIKTQSIPPLGAWVIEGRSVRTGRAAERRGRVLLGCAGALLVAGVAVGFAAWQIADAVSQADDRQLERDPRILG